MNFLTAVLFGFVVVLVADVWVRCQDDEEDEKEPYLGKSLGPFITFSHQISGELYVINRTSFLLRNFFYDGSGSDTYFWVGSSNHADRRSGFPVPDEENKTNVLKRYANNELTLTLPRNKQVADLRWFVIYDVASATSYAEVVFPEDFEPPGARRLQELTRNSHGVKSDPIIALDSKTLYFPDLNYDGLGSETYFWVGSGPVPNSKGWKIPDENGYLEPLRPYEHANITLRLPGNLTIFDIDWLSIFNVPARENYGSMLFPHELNVPPSLVKSLSYYSKLSNCEQLHEKLQISWEVSSADLLMEIAGKIEPFDYMAFGINEAGSKMVGSRVVVVFVNGSKPVVEEYFITDKTPCLPIPHGISTEVKGVCHLQSGDGKRSTSIKIFKSLRLEGVTIVNFTLGLQPGFMIDPHELSTDKHIVWAIGHLNHKFEPLYHHLRNTGEIRLNFARQPAARRCFSFNVGENDKQQPWGPLYIANPYLTSFNLTLGPPAGSRGYEGMTGLNSPGLAWYVNGLLAPELYVKRGQKYRFFVEGGDNIENPAFHHPLYITDGVEGGFATLDEESKKKVQFYAGISTDHKGRPIPVAAGRLCVWENPTLNPRNWDEFRSFAWFKSTLRLNCAAEGKPYVLEWTPNGTVPDVVYYHSFRQRNMGYKIHVVDIVRPSWASKINVERRLVIATIAIIISFNYLRFVFV